MKKIFSFLVMSISLACSTQERKVSVYDVVPFPNEVQEGEGVFNAQGAAVCCCGELDEASRNVVEAFAQKLSAISGVESACGAESACNTQTACGAESSCCAKSACCGESACGAKGGFAFVYDETVANEAYTLDICPEGVTVKASGLRGFNYAIQTLKQLLPVEIFGNTPAPKAAWTLPCLSIQDAPRFAYRGLHLDEGRHFFGVDAVKRYLDIMEVHKLNKFHWHLTEDQGWRIEIKKYPRLTEVGAIRKGTCIKKDFSSTDGVPYGEGLWYTQDQIREIVAYAAAKGIDVIPEIDLPGHMVAALAAYPELGCTGGPYEVWTRWGISEDVLCAGNEKVYAFLEDVLTEVCDLFPYEYIHIGGDECPKVRWESCPKCQAKIKKLGFKDKNGEKAEHFLQSYVITRMEKFLNKKGRKIIGWDEILEGGIAPNATIMSWRGEKGGLEATRQGHDAIMTPNTYYYLDYYQSRDIENEPFGIGGYLPVEKCYSYEPYPADMTDEQKAHILGVQANMWTEYVATEDHLQYMVLPRLAALSEVQWCAADRKDWKRFQEAAYKFCQIYKTMGYNYATHIFQVKAEVEAQPAEKKIMVTLDAPDCAQIKYSLNGRTPGFCAKTYTEPLCIDKTCELKAVALTEGIEPRELVAKFDFHKAVGKNVTYSSKPHRKYCAGAPNSFVDAVRGPAIYKSVEWVAWREKPVDITIDMEGNVSYSNVTTGFLSSTPSHIFFPQRLEISTSEDGENYVVVAAADYEIEGKADADAVKDLTLSFPETSARYLRLTVAPVAAMPQWHDAAGKAAFVFIDEIMVN